MNISDETLQQLKEISDKVTRFEVIDKDGRQYVIWNTSIALSLQDGGLTLKVFVNN